MECVKNKYAKLDERLAKTVKKYEENGGIKDCFKKIAHIQKLYSSFKIRKKKKIIIKKNEKVIKLEKIYDAFKAILNTPKYRYITFVI